MSMRWDGGVCGMWGAKPKVPPPSFPDTLRATPSQGARAFGALLQWYGAVANPGSPETCDLEGVAAHFCGEASVPNLPWGTCCIQTQEAAAHFWPYLRPSGHQAGVISRGYKDRKANPETGEEEVLELCQGRGYCKQPNTQGPEHGGA